MKFSIISIAVCSILLSTMFHSCSKEENKFIEKDFEGQLITYTRGYQPNSQQVQEQHDTINFWVKATLKNDSIYFNTADSNLLKTPTILADINTPFNHSYRLTNTMRPYENVKFINNDSIVYEWSYASPDGANAGKRTFYGTLK